MVLDRPAPGSHDRATPTGTLEESAAGLFEAMLAAREAEEGGADPGALLAFYRALMLGTLLLPVPPEHGEEAKSALASAVNEDEEVEISVMLAADADGKAISVCFGSIAALSAWAPRGTASLPIPARIAIANMAAAGVPAIMDPAGPIPYRFEPDELAALADGRLPGTDQPLVSAEGRRSIRLRLAGPEAAALEASLADSLRGTDVEAAWLVESESNGEHRLLLGLTGREGAAATVDVPDGTDVVWLEEPLLASVRAVTEPFYRRGHR
ncbi:MAG TPA: SseB family protein [Candidatus Dormibacteraeota bacterium]|nr:SseB family protein [Candidatus Dormibacteraeota bacterium]